MTVIDTLVYDRTQADVDRRNDLAENGLSGMTEAELAEWQSGMKGSYNATDLNRVGNALLYLQGELNGYGYAVTVNAKIDWTEADIPTIQQMQTYLNNVAAIRGVLDVFENTPQTPPTMNKLTFQRANDIEKILSDVQKAIDRVVAGFRLSNAFTMVSGSMHLPSLPLAEVTFPLSAVNGEALLTNTGTPIYAVYKRNFKEILTRKGGQT